MKGLVYVLTNPGMPRIVKIGITTRGAIEQRLREMFTTGVPIGSILVFNGDDSGAQAQVCAEKKVHYQGEEYSLTRLTRILFKSEYDIQPTRYWTYSGRSLSVIYDETYTEAL